MLLLVIWWGVGVRGQPGEDLALAVPVSSASHCGRFRAQPIYMEASELCLQPHQQGVPANPSTQAFRTRTL